MEHEDDIEFAERDNGEEEKEIMEENEESEKE
jgi:hypothetical protein